MRTITFYSYKGGTGRTILLANVARIAAHLGLKVVALDFDLEAPGLAYKFGRPDEIRADGLVGWLRDALAKGTTPASLDDYLADVRLATPFVAGGWLKLMPAGRAPSPNYFQDLRRLRLDDRLDDGSAIDALLDLQQRIGDDLGADLLLIDARAGITSTNAVTTHVLGDAVVALALDMPEQLEGTRAVLRGLQPMRSLRTDTPIDLHLILTRVPPSGRDPFSISDADAERIDRVQAFLSEPAQQLANTVTIDEVLLLHAHGELAAHEFLMLEGPGDWTNSPLHIDYQRTARIIVGDPLQEAIQGVIDSARRDPKLFEEIAAFFANPEALEEARAVASRSDAELNRAEERKDAGLAVRVDHLRELARADRTVLPMLARLLDELSLELARLGLRGDALPPAEESASIRRELAQANPAAYLPDLAMSLNNLSNRLSELGRREPALAAIEEAVTLYRALTAAQPDAFTPNLVSSLNNLSNRLSELGRRDDAQHAQDEAADVLRRIAEWSSPSSRLTPQREASGRRRRRAP